MESKVRVTIEHTITGLRNTFEDLYIFELVWSNLQYDSEVDEYTIIWEDLK